MKYCCVLALLLGGALAAGCSRTDGAASPAVPKPAAKAAAAAPVGPPRWFKGNLHTHSLWSDGDDYPERITAWYRDHGYQFLAISDHNVLQRGEKWVRFADVKKKGAGPATGQYLKQYATVARTRGDLSGEAYEIRLTPFEEYRGLFEKPGEYLLIPSEEISDKFEKKPIHICATNLGEPIKPQGGKSVVEVIENNFKAIYEQGRRLNRPILPHLNHPNFQWGVTADEMARVVEERFVEVYNGHPIVNHLGDKDRPGVERMWDIANTLRMTSFKTSPLMGLGTDDTHNYHTQGMKRATAGRGWIHVRATTLTPEALIAAMEKGDFYASSGVTLNDVRYDAAAGTLEVQVAPEAAARFTTRFIGTLAPTKAGATPTESEIGAVLATVEGTKATYKLSGRELYVRAVVTSDQPAENPSVENQLKQAWTQPVGWERHLKN
jgi:hypothetical protein